MILGIGVDLVKISRIEKILDRWNDRFLNRVYTPSEIALCVRRKRPAAAFAMRFAAKEALSKALGTGFRRGLAWKDIEVSRDRRGKPLLALRGKAGNIASEQKVLRSHVSLSDDGEYAVAMVVLED